MITILLVDDHSYIRKGIHYLLESLEYIEVVATADNGIEAVAKARLYQPDIVIIDISMPLMNGIEATRKIRENCHATRVLALSIYDDPLFVKNAVQAGASGYVLKEGLPAELLEAIQSLSSGTAYFSRKIAPFVEPPYMENNDSSTP
jgi:two-component system nitrate/nitrite response regulator NarL